MDERPVSHKDEDLLERGEFIKRLGNALVASDNSRATGVVVGITGEWGSGKSSILNLAAQHLENKRGAIVIQFDPWIISGRDDLISRLLVQIAQKLGADDRGSKAARKILSYAESLGATADAIGSAFGAIGIGAAISMITAAGKKLMGAPDLHERREGVRIALGDCKAPIIVLIDEIDRLEDAEIRAVAQFVRAVADFERISYLLAYDQKRVAEALGGGDIARGTAYLEKIVQYQIPLPVLVKEQLKRLTKDALDEFMPPGWSQGRRWEGMEEILFPNVLQNLRDIKRFTGYANILIGLANEVDQLDLLGWAALAIKAPQTVKTISERPDLVSTLRLSTIQGTRRPDQSERKELTQAERLAEISPDGERTTAIMYLLGALFTKVGTWTNREANLPDRIQNPRPLLTVLSQGIPYGYFSKEDVESFLEMDRNGRNGKLLCFLTSGRLDVFLQRFAPVFSELEQTRQADFWLDVAAFLENNVQDWTREWDIWRSLGRNIFDWIVTRSLAANFPNVATGLRQACLTLDEQGDWQLLPNLLYSQVWAHGLFGCRASDRQPQFLETDEAERLCHRLGRRLVTQFLDDPLIIGKLRAPDALFIATWSEEWTQECRDCLANELENGRILDVLVLLLFGNNSTIERKSLSKLLDADVFTASVANRLEQHADVLSPNLAETYRRIAPRNIHDT